MRDHVDPDALHRVLLELPEYREAMAGDVPGVDAWRVPEDVIA